MNEKNELVSFQDHITHSLAESGVSSDAFVVVKLDEEEWLVDMSILKEASVPPKIAKNAGAPNWVLGIANFRGDVWTILDMKMLLKGRPTSNPRWGWVTLLRQKTKDMENVIFGVDQKIGLLWTEIVEIASKEKYKQDFRSPEQWCRAHYLDKEGRVWRELDIEQIVGERGIIDAWRIRQGGDALSFSPSAPFNEQVNK